MNSTLAIRGGTPVMPEGIVRSRWPLFGEEEIQELVRAMREEQMWATDAPQVKLLEEEWKKRIGAPYCRALGSGTAALHAALWAAGVGSGDEVLVPAYSFMASALVVLHQNAVPVFVDTHPETFTMDPAKIEERISPRTKAILVVHLFGLPADMDEINAIAAKHGLFVIEDCAHAHGARYKDKSTGVLGDAAEFSLNGVKNVAAGEAGLFTTRHEEFVERIDGLWLRVTLNAKREHEKYPLASLGYNYRCNPFAAVIARVQIRRLEELNGLRQRNCERLTRQLREIPGVIPPVVPADRTHVYHMYRVRFDPKSVGIEIPAAEFRAKVVAALAAEGVLCRSWMNWTLPSLPVFSNPEEFETKFPWRRPWSSAVTYNPDEYPEATRIVTETAMVADAPTATSPEVIDYIAEGFRKVFSHLDEVVDLQLPEALMQGGEANLAEIRSLIRGCMTRQ